MTTWVAAMAVWVAAMIVIASTAAHALAYHAGYAAGRGNP